MTWSNPGRSARSATWSWPRWGHGLDLVFIGAASPAPCYRTPRSARTWACRSRPTCRSSCPDSAPSGVRALVDGAAYLYSIECGEALVGARAHRAARRSSARVGVRVTTLGPTSAQIERTGAIQSSLQQSRRSRRSTQPERRRLPVGFLPAVAWGLPLQRAAQLGCMLAVHVLETVGTQEYELKPGGAGRAAGRRIRRGCGRGDRRALQLGRPAARRACRRVHSSATKPAAAADPAHAGGDGPGAGRPLRDALPLATAARVHPECNSSASRRRWRRRSP